MISISLRELAANLTGFFFWASFAVTAFLFLITVVVNICSHYNDKEFWPKKAMKFMIADSFRSWFHLALLIFNIMFCLRLIISGGYSWWFLAIPPVSFPLSGIILTWTARISAVIGWVVSKTIENYLKIFRKNWF